ncbi:trypsin-like peptidase domain-containing protein [Streptomyces sp. NPDC005492]|uniref:trypsin-like peptidase domain-containing protein n=1 Tax=Streptomyces sp. NPDC005492 TaxID=3156883 RepID=UPI0033B9CEFB
MDGRQAFAATGLDPDRVAEIIVDRPGEPHGDRGSGYRVRTGFVLTAAHVVRDASRVRVRFRADQPGAWATDGTVVWRADDIDVAIVAISDAGRPAGPVTPVRFGRIEEYDGEVPCSALGFPRHKLRFDVEDPSSPAASSAYRDYAHVTGTTNPWSNLREGTLSVRVAPPEYDPDPESSPWEGMSGAAVWSDGCLIGLIRSHHRSDGLGQLAASRVEGWYERLDETQLGELALLIGLPPREQLTLVALPRGSHGRRDDSVEALLRAEAIASSVQPYRIPGGRTPRLSQVYVRQWADRRSDSAEGPGAETEFAVDRVPVAEVLAAHRHVLVEGGPGAGKSTFTHHVSGALATSWLDNGAGPEESAQLSAVAVRIPAGHLAGDAPLASLLHASVRTRLGIRLATELPDDLFAATPRGVPWLLLVDGLDEILDPVARERVITTIAENAAAATAPYRWVVTTRPLPTRELGPLWDAGLARCALAPFEDPQLRELAEGWLAGSSDDESATARVDDFLREVDESGLHQLVRAPLLATITLTIFRRHGTRGLPAGRPGLYREFIAYLLTGRDGETARRTAFLQAAEATGAGRRLAEWLYENRVALLRFLANRTLEAESSLLGESLAWIRAKAPEAPDFLLGWPDIVVGLLTGTGLLGDDGTGELSWTHRSFAEYLAARDAADALPDLWPGDDPDADAFLRQALEGTGQDQSALTIACWAETHESAAGRLLDFLIARSASYEFLLKSRGGGITVGNDSSRVDRHIALAGRLLAEGVPAASAVSEEVLDRLLVRARSLFTAHYFCLLIAAQPQRDLARNALLRMAYAEDLPAMVRIDAVVTLGRIFGLESLEGATRSLLDVVERTQYSPPTERGQRLVTVSDARAVMAYKLSALGQGTRTVVAAFLDRVALDREDGWGRYLAAEAALAIGEPDRAASFLLPPPEKDHRTIAGEVSVLVRAGRVQAAARTVEALFANHRPDNHWARDSLLGSVQEIADVYVRAGLTDQALDVARRMLSLFPEGTSAGSLDALARAGDVLPGVRFLRTATIGDPDSRDPAPHVVRLGDWIDLARTLWKRGMSDAVREAVDLLLAHGFRSEYDVSSMADFLDDIEDDRARHLRRWLAVNAGARLRLSAAEALLETEDRALGIEALTRLAQEPPDDMREAVDLVRSLLLVGVVEPAVDLLHRLIDGVEPDAREGRWAANNRCDAFDLICWVRPAEGTRVLLDLVRSGSLTGAEYFSAARNLLRLEEHTAALTMLHEVLERDTATGEELLQTAVLLGAAGERTDTVRACELILELAGRVPHSEGEEPSVTLSEVLPAAHFLESEGRLGPHRSAALTSAAMTALRTKSAWDKRAELFAVAGLLHRNGAEAAAIDLLTRAIGHDRGSEATRTVFEEEIGRLRSMGEGAGHES